MVGMRFSRNDPSNKRLIIAASRMATLHVCTRLFKTNDLHHLFTGTPVMTTYTLYGRGIRKKASRFDKSPKIMTLASFPLEQGDK